MTITIESIKILLQWNWAVSLTVGNAAVGLGQTQAWVQNKGQDWGLAGEEEAA